MPRTSTLAPTPQGPTLAVTPRTWIVVVPGKPTPAAVVVESVTEEIDVVVVTTLLVGLDPDVEVVLMLITVIVPDVVPAVVDV